MSLPAAPSAHDHDSHSSTKDTCSSAGASFSQCTSQSLQGPSSSQPIDSSEPSVHRGPVTVPDEALVRELRAAVESMFIDRTNTQEPELKKVTRDGTYDAKPSRSRHRSRGNSIAHPTPAETKNNWRSGSNDPQCDGSSLLSWRPARGVDFVPSEANKRSRENSLIGGLYAERKVKQWPNEDLS